MSSLKIVHFVKGKAVIQGLEYTLRTDKQDVKRKKNQYGDGTGVKVKVIAYQVNSRSHYKQTAGSYKAFFSPLCASLRAKWTWGGEKALDQQQDNTFTSSLIHHPNIMVWS